MDARSVNRFSQIPVCQMKIHSRYLPTYKLIPSSALVVELSETNVGERIMMMVKIKLILLAVIISTTIGQNWAKVGY